MPEPGSDETADREVTPYTIAEAYHRGELTRDQVIQQLVDYDYLPQDEIPDDMTQDVGLYVDGSWDDVQRARRNGLIDGDIYSVVLQAVEANERRRPPQADR